MDGATFVAEASSGQEALDALSETEVDVALVDISMDGMSGIELTRRLQERRPALSVLIVSVHAETQYVEDALDAGASGYVLKDNAYSALREAISSAVDGEVYLDEDLRYKPGY